MGGIVSHGKAFEKDVVQSLRSAGHWTERFRDNTWSNMAGSNESPPDAISIVHGVPCLMELKAITTGMDSQKRPRDLMKGAISTNRCEGHQLQRPLQFELER